MNKFLNLWQIHPFDVTLAQGVDCIFDCLDQRVSTKIKRSVKQNRDIRNLIECINEIVVVFILLWRNGLDSTSVVNMDDIPDSKGCLVAIFDT